MIKIILGFFFILIFFVYIDDAHAKLDEEKLANKKENWYLTGLPLVNYSSDRGFGYGVRVYIFDNGDREEKYFDESPYFTRIYAQFYTTTLGFSYHELNLDKYNILCTKFRIKTSFIYDRMLNSNYYGIGKEAAKKQLVDIYGNEYSTFEDFEKEFLKAGDRRYYKYNNYMYLKPTYRFYFFGDLSYNIKFLTGFEVKYAKIETYYGKTFKDDDGNKHTSDITLLDLHRDLVVGFDGGWTNTVKLGLAYDTRDFEPDPGSGYYIEYSFLIADKIIGSDYNYYRSTFGARTYVTLIKPLVMAVRLGYTDTSSGTPFYETQNFEFLFYPQEGLGGFTTLRGYPQYRFVGKTMTLGNLEYRLKLAETMFLKQRFELKLIAFADTGNVYDRASSPFNNPRWTDYKYSYGGGLVIAWNQATILHVYVGFSPEDMGVSVNFEHSI